MELIFDGVKLMVMGMAGVFVFLILMIWFMNLMSRGLAPFAAREAEKAAAAKKGPGAAGSPDGALEAAVAAAAFNANSNR